MNNIKNIKDNIQHPLLQSIINIIDVENIDISEETLKNILADLKNFNNSAETDAEINALAYICAENLKKHDNANLYKTILFGLVSTENFKPLHLGPPGDYGYGMDKDPETSFLLKIVREIDDYSLIKNLATLPWFGEYLSVPYIMRPAVVYRRPYRQPYISLAYKNESATVTLLGAALYAGNVNTIRALLEVEADPNQEITVDFGSGYVKKPPLAIVTVAYEQGVSDTNKSAAAMVDKASDICKLLLQYGADPNFKVTYLISSFDFTYANVTPFETIFNSSNFQLASRFVLYDVSILHDNMYRNYANIDAHSKELDIFIPKVASLILLNKFPMSALQIILQFMNDFPKDGKLSDSTGLKELVKNIVNKFCKFADDSILNKFVDTLYLRAKNHLLFTMAFNEMQKYFDIADLKNNMELTDQQIYEVKKYCENALFDFLQAENLLNDNIDIFEIYKDSIAKEFKSAFKKDFAANDSWIYNFASKHGTHLGWAMVPRNRNVKLTFNPSETNNSQITPMFLDVNNFNDFKNKFGKKFIDIMHLMLTDTIKNNKQNFGLSFLKTKPKF